MGTHSQIYMFGLTLLYETEIPFLRESSEDITMSVFRTGSRLISAGKRRSALIPAPSLCNAALQGQVIAKRTLLERPGVPDNIKKVYFNLQGFNQYGLLHDDVLHETEIIQEAISRLPPEMQDERNFRITRALQCSVEKLYFQKINGLHGRNTKKREHIYNHTLMK